MRHRGWQNNEIAEFQRMPSALRKRFTVLIPLCAKVDICARSVFIFLIIIIFFFFFWGPAAQHTPPIFETNSDPSVFRWQQGAGFLSFVAGPKSILSHLTRKSHYRTLSPFSFHCAHPRLIWSHRTFGPSLLGFGLQVDRFGRSEPNADAIEAGPDGNSNRRGSSAASAERPVPPSPSLILPQKAANHALSLAIILPIKSIRSWSIDCALSILHLAKSNFGCFTCVAATHCRYSSSFAIVALHMIHYRTSYLNYCTA